MLDYEITKLRNIFGGRVSDLLMEQYQTLPEIARASEYELLAIPGIGPKTAQKVITAFNLASTKNVRMLDQKVEANCPANIVKLFYARHSMLEVENLEMALIDEKNSIFAITSLDIGTNERAMLYISHALRVAVTYSASSVALIHNHPSGNPGPSQNDKISTTRFTEACNIIGIRLLDHIIIGSRINPECKMPQKCYSFAHGEFFNPDQGVLELCAS